MGCLYENFKGYCTLESDDETVSCDYSSDPDPADSCENYETDWYCPDCGVDLNVEVCRCDNN